MELEIVYCALCNYEPQAVSLTDHLMKTFKTRLERIVLVPDRGGKFEVSIDGQLVFSRLKDRRFPSHDEIAAVLESALTAAGR